MAKISNKMSKLLKRAEILQTRGNEIKAQLEAIEFEIKALAAEETSKAANIEIKDFSVLIDEHNLVQKLKENGYSYTDIQALIKEKKEKKNDDEIF